jgi:hypothetical protein
MDPGESRAWPIFEASFPISSLIAAERDLFEGIKLG